MTKSFFMKCEKCGYLLEGYKGKSKCPNCGNVLKYFYRNNIDLNWMFLLLLIKGSKVYGSLINYFHLIIWIKLFLLGEGNTPLSEANNLREYLNFKGCIHLKDETQNPTGTYKDRRPASVGLSKAVECGLFFGDHCF